MTTQTNDNLEQSTFDDQANAAEALREKLDDAMTLATKPSLTRKKPKP